MPISVSILSDNMRFMEQYPDGFFGLSPDDPPYALRQNLKKAQSRGKLARTAIKDDFTWDYQTPTPEYFTELKRATKNQIIWGANYFPEICGEPFKAPRRHEYMEFIERHPIGWIIWDKVNGASDFSDCELAWTSFQYPSRVFHFMWSGMLQGLSIQHGTVMQGNKKFNEKRIHPTQKPLPLCQWQLQEYAQPGEKILDPHSGSQSMRIAAYKMGFDYYGCDNNVGHFRDGCARFQEQITTPMFQL